MQAEYHKKVPWTFDAFFFDWLKRLLSSLSLLDLPKASLGSISPSLLSLFIYAYMLTYNSVAAVETVISTAEKKEWNGHWEDT